MAAAVRCSETPPKAAPPAAQRLAAAPRLNCPSRTRRTRSRSIQTATSWAMCRRPSVGKDDTLPDIARRFDVGYEEMLTANPGVDPWLPGVGREVVVPTQFVLPAAPHEGVVVNVAAMRIFYYPPHKKGEPQMVYTHPIGIGKVGWKTPEGTTKIVSRQKDPVWIVPKSVRDEHAENGEKLPAQVPAGPDNPLGPVHVPPGLAELSDPRHEQALRRGHALEPRLHAPVSGGHRGVFRSDPHRHQGDGGQSALLVRLARRHLVSAGLHGHGR